MGKTIKIIITEGLAQAAPLVGPGKYVTMMIISVSEVDKVPGARASSGTDGLNEFAANKDVRAGVHASVGKRMGNDTPRSR